MSTITRRTFLEMAALFGASAAWGTPFSKLSTVAWRERRDLYPEGVASGDPDSNSVLLWTRRGQASENRVQKLTLEVSEDESFRHVIATKAVPISEASDWTCRVLVGGLKPAHVYWYRFTDAEGLGSRIGRTITAPADDDPRPARFAFVSCQNANFGAMNAYRRMIFEDERASEQDRLGFVLHLGDFIYELVWYPEDKSTYYDRRVREIVRYAHGEKIQDFHIPTTLEDYRSVYRAYLHDPDLQDARARWPFVPMWDNHEYSWQGWQGMQVFDGKTRPAQTLKVVANQVFFEYQPARMARPSSTSLEEFHPPKVADTPVTVFDDHGLGQEPNNLTAINSLKGYRSLRWGRNLDLVITDERSYRSEEPTGDPSLDALSNNDFGQFFAEELNEILDAGRSYNSGKPPDVLRFGKAEVPNPRKNSPPQTILGAEQKAWFLEKLRSSRATWKIWGSTTATLDMRADPQNLPAGLTSTWPGAGFASMAGGSIASAITERGEIYDFVRDQGITGFAAVAGDLHSFWAGLAAKALPPRRFEPVGVAFVTGSISAPGTVEAFEHKISKKDPLRPLFLGQGPEDKTPQPTVNMLVKHGVRSCLEYAKTGDIAKARRLSNPELSPHVNFVDMGGHGYAVVRVASEEIETEFVCIPRPGERSDRADGGPLVYRVSHSTKLWQKGKAPKLTSKILEGNPVFSM
jgi:alkaline phosphatase D